MVFVFIDENKFVNRIIHQPNMFDSKDLEGGYQVELPTDVDLEEGKDYRLILVNEETVKWIEV